MSTRFYCHFVSFNVKSFAASLCELCNLHVFLFVNNIVKIFDKFSVVKLIIFITGKSKTKFGHKAAKYLQIYLYFYSRLYSVFWYCIYFCVNLSSVILSLTGLLITYPSIFPDHQHMFLSDRIFF